MLCDPLNNRYSNLEWLYSGSGWCSDGAVEKGQDLFIGFPVVVI